MLHKYTVIFSDFSASRISGNCDSPGHGGVTSFSSIHSSSVSCFIFLGLCLFLFLFFFHSGTAKKKLELSKSKRTSSPSAFELDSLSKVLLLSLQILATLDADVIRIGNPQKADLLASLVLNIFILDYNTEKEKKVHLE